VHGLHCARTRTQQDSQHRRCRRTACDWPALLGAQGFGEACGPRYKWRTLSSFVREAFRSLAAEVDHLVAVCQWARELLIENGVPARKITLSRHGLSTDAMGMESIGEPDRNLEGKLRIAYFGRLDPSKGPLVLIQAMRSIPEAQVQLDVYGVEQGGAGTGYTRVCKKLAASDSRISFLPPLPNAQVVSTLKKYAALAVPSQWLETGPLVVLEAFSAGVPVIGSNLGGIAELVEHGVDGLLVDAQAPGEWAPRVSNALVRCWFAAAPPRRRPATTPYGGRYRGYAGHLQRGFEQTAGLPNSARRVRSARRPSISRRRVLYVQYTNPGGYPPLEHSSRILADAGWQVLFLGTGALGAGSLRLPPHPGVSLKQISFQQSGWRQKLHYAWFSAWVLAWTLVWRPTWVYASDLLACPPALLISRLLGLKIVYHEHDTPAAGSAGFIGRVCSWSRRRLAARADLRVLPNERRAVEFVRSVASDRPALTVWNCPAKDEVATTRLASKQNSVELVYHGSVGPARLPLTVIEALAKLPPTVRLHVLGYETAGHRGYMQTLRQVAQTHGVTDRLQFHGALPLRGDLLRTTGRFDVGLALMPKLTDDPNMRRMTGASNKPFDYLARGLALLVSDLPDWQEMYVEPGYGLALQSG